MADTEDSIASGGSSDNSPSLHALVMFVVPLVMLMVGLLLLAYGYYAVWYLRREDRLWRALLSFVYLIPGWALITMGYVGWRIEALRAARQSSQNRKST